MANSSKIDMSGLTGSEEMFWQFLDQVSCLSDIPANLIDALNLFEHRFTTIQNIVAKKTASAAAPATASATSKPNVAPATASATAPATAPATASATASATSESKTAPAASTTDSATASATSESQSWADMAASVTASASKESAKPEGWSTPKKVNSRFTKCERDMVNSINQALKKFKNLKFNETSMTFDPRTEFGYMPREICTTDKCKRGNNCNFIHGSKKSPNFCMFCILNECKAIHNHCVKDPIFGMASHVDPKTDKVFICPFSDSNGEPLEWDGYTAYAKKGATLHELIIAALS